jgi:hypothetical protein
LPFRTGAPASDTNLRQGDPIGDERGGIAGDHRLERLIDRLPRFLRSSVRWLRRPSLIAGGLLSFLPILGLWMLPLGAMLLSDDLSSLRSWRTRLLDWMERRYPRWFAD